MTDIDNDTLLEIISNFPLDSAHDAFDLGKKNLAKLIKNEKMNKFLEIPYDFFSEIAPNYVTFFTSCLNKQNVMDLFGPKSVFSSFLLNLPSLYMSKLQDKLAVLKAEPEGKKTNLHKIQTKNKTILMSKSNITHIRNDEFKTVVGETIGDEMQVYSHGSATYSISQMITSGLRRSELKHTPAFSKLITSLAKISYDTSYDANRAQIFRDIESAVESIQRRVAGFKVYKRENILMWSLGNNAIEVLPNVDDDVPIIDENGDINMLLESKDVFDPKLDFTIPFKQGFKPNYLTVNYDSAVFTRSAMLDDVLNLGLYDRFRAVVENTYCGASGVSGQLGRLEAGYKIYELGNPLAMFNHMFFDDLVSYEIPVIPTSKVAMKDYDTDWYEYSQAYFKLLDTIFDIDSRNAEFFDSDFMTTLARQRDLTMRGIIKPFDKVNMNSSSGLPYNKANREVVDETVHNAELLFDTIADTSPLPPEVLFIKVSSLQTKIEHIDAVKRGIKERNICPGHMCHMLPTLMVYHSLIDQLSNPLNMIMEYMESKPITSFDSSDAITFYLDSSVSFRNVMTGVLEDIYDAGNIFALHKFTIAHGCITALRILVECLDEGVYYIIYSDNIYILNKHEAGASWTSLDGSSFESSCKPSLLYMNNLYLLHKMGWEVKSGVVHKHLSNQPIDEVVLTSSFDTEFLSESQIYARNLKASEMYPKRWAAFYLKQSAVTIEKIVAWGNRWIKFPGLPSGEPNTYLHNTVNALLASKTIQDNNLSSLIVPDESVESFEIDPKVMSYLNGLKLTGELHVKGESSIFSSGLNGTFKLDLLGYDALRINIDGVTFEIPILNEERFNRSLLFPIRSPNMSRELDGATPEQYELIINFLNLMRYRALHIAGGWWYCNELLLHLINDCISALGFPDPASVSDVLREDVIESIDLAFGDNIETPINIDSFQGILDYLERDAMFEAIRVYCTKYDYLKLQRIKNISELKFAEKMKVDRPIILGNYKIASYAGFSTEELESKDESIPKLIKDKYKKIREAVKDKSIVSFRGVELQPKVWADFKSSLLLKDLSPLSGRLPRSDEKEDSYVDKALTLYDRYASYVIPLTIAETVRYYHMSYDERVTKKLKIFLFAKLLNQIALKLLNADLALANKPLRNISFMDRVAVLFAKGEVPPLPKLFPLPVTRMIYYDLPMLDHDGRYHGMTPPGGKKSDKVGYLLGLPDNNPDNWHEPSTSSLLDNITEDVEDYFKEYVPKLVNSRLEDAFLKKVLSKTRDEVRETGISIHGKLSKTDKTDYKILRTIEEKQTIRKASGRLRAAEKLKSLAKHKRVVRHDKKRS